MTPTVPLTGFVLAMGASPDQAVSPLVQLIPFALVLGIFYFVILLPMKFKLFIGTVAFAMLVLAVAGWAVDGLRWALPARA